MTFTFHPSVQYREYGDRCTEVHSKSFSFKMSVQIIFRKDKFREYLKIFQGFYLFFNAKKLKIVTGVVKNWDLFWKLDIFNYNKSFNK